jgi:PhzF family phenazine biosynthesis protein
VRFFQVDCFADRPFAGNPNAVVLLDSEWPEAEWLQQLAAEVNLPATAFICGAQPQSDLRWFSPRSELALCGSGTLAAAHILWEQGEQDVMLTFATCAGQLRAQRQSDRRITLSLPRDDLMPVAVNPKLVDMLGIEPRAVARGRLDLLVELDSADAVRRTKPDLVALAKLEARGLIVTARGDADADFVSRYFAPAAGIDEDPVTASAHCTLGAYWSIELETNVLTGHQISARGGRIEIRLRDDCVDATGSAVTVVRGELAI